MAKNKYIETPEVLWNLFLEYTKEVKDNPIIKMEYKGGQPVKVFYELEKPLTLDGFENYVADKGIINDLGDYFSNKDGRYTQYTTICSRIRRKIRQDQIEGGMVGVYNPSITQRLNNLVDKQENTIKTEQPLFGNE